MKKISPAGRAFHSYLKKRGKSGEGRGSGVLGSVTLVGKTGEADDETSPKVEQFA